MAVNLGQPVNWQHSLNRSRTAWWLGIGNPYHGGSSLGDLCNRNRTSLVAPAWTRLPYIMPWMGLNNSSACYGTAGSSSTLNYANNFTLAASFTYNGNGAAQGVISHSTGGYYLRLNNGKLNILQSQTADIASGGTTLTAGNSYRGLVTIDAAGNGVIYLNGISDGTFTTAISFSGSSGLLLGADAGGGEIFQLYSGDYSIWNRALSASEALLDYRESLAGYPNTLNRTKPGFITTVSAPPASTYTGARMHRYPQLAGRR